MVAFSFVSSGGNKERRKGKVQVGLSWFRRGRETVGKFLKRREKGGVCLRVFI